MGGVNASELELSLSRSQMSKNFENDDAPPSYPILDTIVLLLILTQFPTVLVMITHSLFSVRDWKYSQNEDQARQSCAPISVVLFIDAVVMLFTLFVMPRLRNLITDLSHVFVSVSLSGASGWMILPFSSAILLQHWACEIAASFGSDADFKISSSIKSKMRAMFRGPEPWTLRNSHSYSFYSSSPSSAGSTTSAEDLMGFIRDTVAIHVFAIGLSRLWVCIFSRQPSSRAGIAVIHEHESLNSVPQDGVPTVPSKNENMILPEIESSESLSGKKVGQSDIYAPKIHQRVSTPFTIGQRQSGTPVSSRTRPISFGGSSMWDVFLHWLVDRIDKTFVFAPQLPQHDVHIWISEVTAKQISVGLSMPVTSKPEITVKVNGLSWDTNVISMLPLESGLPLCASSDRLDSERRDTYAEDQTTWQVSICNLSPMTEYDISLGFCRSTFGQTNLSVCTSPRTESTQLSGPVSLKSRGERNESNTHTSTTPVLPLAASQPSFVTLEESIAIAQSDLDSLKYSLKRTRKDNTKRTQSIQREVDHLQSRFASIDKTEQRMQGRILNLQTEIRRLQETLEDLDCQYEKMMEQRASRQPLWQSRSSEQHHEFLLVEKFRDYYCSFKEELEGRLAVAEQETTKTRAKAEKMSLKRTKLTQDLDRLQEEQHEIVTREFVARHREREDLRLTRQQVEHEFRSMMRSTQDQLDFLMTYNLKHERLATNNN